jgi:hypothetical protein
LLRRKAILRSDTIARVRGRPLTLSTAHLLRRQIRRSLDRLFHLVTPPADLQPLWYLVPD